MTNSGSFSKIIISLIRLTAKENILLPISLGKMKKKEAEARFNEIADDSWHYRYCT